MPEPAKAPKPMSKLSFKLSNYHRQTPKPMKVWADRMLTLQVVGNMLIGLYESMSASSFLLEYKWYIIAANIALVAGKLLTNGFARTYEP